MLWFEGRVSEPAGCNLETLCLWFASWLMAWFLFSWAVWRLEIVLSRFSTNKPKRALPLSPKAEGLADRNRTTYWNWSTRPASRRTTPAGCCKRFFNWSITAWSWSFVGSRGVSIEEALVGVWHYWRVKETSSRSLSMSPRPSSMFEPGKEIAS